MPPESGDREVPTGKVACSSCGHMMRADSVYCRKCGQKREQVGLVRASKGQFGTRWMWSMTTWSMRRGASHREGLESRVPGLRQVLDARRMLHILRKVEEDLDLYKQVVQKQRALLDGQLRIGHSRSVYF